MKNNILLPLLLLFMQNYAWSQSSIHIDTIEVIPGSPTVSDTVKIKTQVTSNDYGRKIYDSLSVIGNTIKVYYCISLSAAPATKTFTDTFTIGVLPQGFYTIDVKAFKSTDTAQCIPYDSVNTVKTLVVWQANSVQENILGKGYSVYVFPNPAKDQQQLIIATDLPKTFEVLLYNASGQLMKELYAGHISPGKQTLTIETSYLPKGIYFYQMTADNKKHSLKTIIK